MNAPQRPLFAFKFGLDEQYSSLKGTVNGLRQANFVEMASDLPQWASILVRKPAE
jgi:hypothetical protein